MCPLSDCAIDCSEYVKKNLAEGNYEHSVKFRVLDFKLHENLLEYIDFLDIRWYNVL
jgi:hypothetical protein